jgi:hypothetical protein
MAREWKRINDGGVPGRVWCAPQRVSVIVLETAEWYVKQERGDDRDPLHITLSGTAISVARAKRYALRAYRHFLPILRDHREQAKERRWDWGFQTLMREILTKYPKAEYHLPGEPLTFGIIPRKDVKPKWHFVVDNFGLRGLGRAAIVEMRKRGIDLRCDDANGGWRDGDRDPTLVIMPAQ